MKVKARIAARASAYAGGGLYDSVPPGFVYPSTAARNVAFTRFDISTITQFFHR